MDLQVTRAIADHATTRPETPAVVALDRVSGDATRSLTYWELHEAVLRQAGVIQDAGPRCGTLMIVAGQTIEAVVGVLSAWSGGYTAFPVSPSRPDPELLSGIKKAEVVGVLGSWERCAGLAEAGLPRIPLLEPESGRASPTDRRIHDPQGTGPELRLFSSGSTGEPRIVRRDGPAIDAVTRNVVDHVGLVEQDRVFAVAPVYHSYGVESCLLGPLTAGATLFLVDRFDAGLAVEALVRHRITVFPGVPAVFEQLATLTAGGPAPRTDLRCTYSAGASLPDGVFEVMERSWGVRVGQLYGSSELGSATFHHPGERDFQRGCVGRTMNGVQIRIVNPSNGTELVDVADGGEGEIAVSAPSMMYGYAGDDSPPFPEGFLRTGDLGRLDSLGRLFVTGRLKFIIDVGGSKVNPLEVERVLREHEGVCDCIVVPIPVTETISRLKAVIVPKDPSSAPSVDALRKLVRSRLEPAKVPRVFEIRSSLPRSPAGKVLRHQI